MHLPEFDKSANHEILGVSIPRLWNTSGIFGAPDRAIELAASGAERAFSGVSSGIDASKRLLAEAQEHPIATTAIVGGALLAVPAARMAARSASNWFGRGTLLGF